MDLTSDRTLIAIDGGNSKTDAVLLRGDGSVIARARSGPFAPHMIGAVEAVASLASAVRSLLDQAGAQKVDLIAAFMANADLPVEVERLQVAFESHAWAERVVVDNDTLALLRTGTSGSHGVAVVCGAGINAVGVSPSGTRVRYPALGRITGDWGGGFALAKEALWATSRFEDGRGPETSLAARVANHFGYPTAVDVSIAMHLREIDYDRMHEIVPLLLTAADEGDEVALAMVTRQAEEIALLATTTLRRLHMLERPTEIVLGGGILSSGRRVILDPIHRAIAAGAPHATIVTSRDAPVIGAALLGLDLLWAGDAPQSALDQARQLISTAERAAL